MDKKKKKGCILIVEDGKFDAALIKSAIEDMEEYDAEVATSAERATHMVNDRIISGEEEYVLYVVDEDLPGRDGLSFIQGLKGRGFLAPVIINTGNIDILERLFVAARELNVSGVLMDKIIDADTREELLKQAIRLSLSKLGKGLIQLETSRDRTIKYKIPVLAAGCFEIVDIRDRGEDPDVFDAWTICSSTQTGCWFDCRFCATGCVKKNVRNLTYEEMNFGINVSRYFQKRRRKKIHVTLSGMGEPFHNLWNVFNLMEKSGRDYTFRMTTTVPSLKHFQLFKGMLLEYEHARRRFKQLSISIHFFRDEIRKKHMPLAAKKISVEEIIWAANNLYADEKIRKAGIEICLNVAVFKGINDTQEDLDAIVSSVSNAGLFVRIMRANNFNDYRHVGDRRLTEIRNYLVSKGVKCKKIFHSRGVGRHGGCGQLAFPTGSQSQSQSQ